MGQFYKRLEALPTLGMGISTEYGAFQAEGSLDLERLKKTLPQCAEVLELGIEVIKGLDTDALNWIKDKQPTTYHFLDINLDDPNDFDDEWLAQVRALIELAQPAWLCGDAGLWHHGPRSEGHMLLLPPILTKDSAYALADGIIKLREETGLEVLPENPPGHIYVGPLHILDFFAIVLERADTGMLLDLAHLSIYQNAMGFSLKTGIDGFPIDKVIEVHMAGGSHKVHQGLAYIADDHSPVILPETWSIFNMIADQLTELRAVIFECERNSFESCQAPLLELRQHLDMHLPSHSAWRSK